MAVRCLFQGLLQCLGMDPGCQVGLESKDKREEKGRVATSRPSQCHALKVVQHA